MLRSLCNWSEDLTPPNPPTTSFGRYPTVRSPWPVACAAFVPFDCAFSVFVPWLWYTSDFSRSSFYLICSGFDNLILFQTPLTLRCRPAKARAISPHRFIKKRFHGRSTFLRAVRPVPALGKLAGVILTVRPPSKLTPG